MTLICSVDVVYYRRINNTVLLVRVDVLRMCECNNNVALTS
jgi:hypothetical protein